MSNKLRLIGPAALWRDLTIRRIIANSSWLLGARALNAPLALVESVLLARLLGLEEYGVLGVVIAMVQVMHRLLSFRMSEFAVKYLSVFVTGGDKRKAAAALKIALLAEAATALLALGVVLLSSRWLAGSFLGGDDSSHVVKLYALAIICGATSEATAGALQVFNRFRQQAAINVARKVILVAGILIAFAAQAGLRSVLIAYLVSMAAGTIAQLATAHQAATDTLGGGWWRQRLAHLRDEWRRLTRFAASVNVGATLAVIVKESDLLWLSYFRPPVEAGFFKLASTLLRVPYAAGSPMTKAVYPELARAAGNHQQLRRLTLRSTMLAATWVVPASLALALAAPWLVPLLYGGDFGPSVQALWILMAGSSVAQVFFWTRPALLAFERADIALSITVFHAGAKVVLALLLVPAHGYLALAAISAALNLSGVALSLYFIRDSLRALAKDSRSTAKRSS